MKTFCSKKSGFTFIETLLAVIIIGIIAGVVAKVLIAGLDVYALIVNRNDAFQSARAAMFRMQDEILLVKGEDILSLSDSRFRFKDINGSPTDFRRATLYRGGELNECINRGNDYLVGNITQLDFDYFNAAGAPTIWPNSVRRINIEFTVAALANAGSVHLRTDVFPRNFMYSNFE